MNPENLKNRFSVLWCCSLREFYKPMMKYIFRAWTCLKRTGGPCAQAVDESFSIEGHDELYV